MKSVIVVLLTTMLCACVTTPSENKTSRDNANDRWVGRTVDELIIANGEPSDIYTIEGGIRVFEYLNLKQATTGTQQSTKSSTLPSLSNDPNAQRVRAKRKKSAPDQSPSCKILFQVSASDIIESWSTEGEKCN